MADTNLLILAREFKKLRTHVQEVLKMPVGPQGLQGEKGEQGVKGDTGAPGKDGKDGKDGVNGLNGQDGRNGADGKDGKDGLDGVGVQNAYIDFDNSLVIVLTNGQEINAGFLSQEAKDAVVATFKQGAQTLNELLPIQTGNANKFLKTDGENVSWDTLDGSDINLASPPAIGGTAPNAATFTTLTANSTFQFGKSSANYGQGIGGATTKAVEFRALGSDTNVALAVRSQGTGAIDLAAGSSGVNISNGTTVTAITRTAVGSGYTSVPSVVISAPTTAGGVQATATVSVGVSTFAVASGGSGYTVGDSLTVVGGTGVATVVTVSTVSAGAVTGVTYASGGSYTVTPTNPVSVTGGTGTGATLNITYTINNAFTITNAGSGYVEQPTVTFSGGGGSGAAAYASVGSSSVLRSLAGSGGGSSSLSIFSAGGEAVRITDAGGSLVNFWRMQGAPTNSGVQLQATGADSNVSGLLSTKGTSSFGFYTNTFAQQQFNITHTASAVNYVQVTGAATGGAPVTSVQGSDTNIAYNFTSKGNGAFNFFTNNSAQRQFRVTHTTSAVNFGYATGSAAGGAVTFGVDALSSDTNVDLALTPKGTGLVRFGTRTASADAPITGYIEIKDSGGTVRRLAVIG